VFSLVAYAAQLCELNELDEAESFLQQAITAADNARDSKFQALAQAMMVRESSRGKLGFSTMAEQSFHRGYIKSWSKKKKTQSSISQ
jgi:hypothetical protein